MIRIFIPILQPYRINFYNKLIERAGDEVMIFHAKTGDDGRANSRVKPGCKTIDYTEKRWKLLSFTIIVWIGFKSLLPKRKDVVVLQPILGNITMLWLIIYSRLVGARLIFWSCAYSIDHGKGLMRMKRIVEKLFFNQADGIIAYSTHAQKHAISLGFKRSIWIAYNGIDLPEFSNNVLNSNLFRIGYVGALIPEKRPDLLCEAFRHLDNDKFSLEVIGDGYLRESLERMYGREVKFHGFKDQKSDFLANLDVLVIPGQGGLIALESLYQNTYVLSSDGCDKAVEDCLIEGINGEFFASDLNAIELALKIMKLARSVPKVNSKYGRRLIEEKFTTSSMVDTFVKSIHSINR